METCKCSKEKTIEEMRRQIQAIQLKDVEKEKDMERFRDTLDQVNKSIKKLNSMLEELNNKPLEKYEKIWNIVMGGAIGAIMAFIMNAILGGK